MRLQWDKFISTAFAAEALDLGLLLDQVGRYPFLETLRPVAESCL